MLRSPHNRKVKMRTQISDYELITFFNNLKEIIRSQKELNHELAKRITTLELQTKVDKITAELAVKKVRKDVIQKK